MQLFSGSYEGERPVSSANCELTGRQEVGRQDWLYEPDAVVGDGDEAPAVEVANGLLVGLLGDAEAGGDVLSRRMVGQGAVAVVLVEVA